MTSVGEPDSAHASMNTASSNASSSRTAAASRASLRCLRASTNPRGLIAASQSSRAYTLADQERPLPTEVTSGTRTRRATDSVRRARCLTGARLVLLCRHAWANRSLRSRSDRGRSGIARISRSRPARGFPRARGGSPSTIEYCPQPEAAGDPPLAYRGIGAGASGLFDRDGGAGRLAGRAGHGGARWPPAAAVRGDPIGPVRVRVQDAVGGRRSRVPLDGLAEEERRRFRRQPAEVIGRSSTESRAVAAPIGASGGSESHRRTSRRRRRSSTSDRWSRTMSPGQQARRAAQVALRMDFKTSHRTASTAAKTARAMPSTVRAPARFKCRRLREQCCRGEAAIWPR
jgi:hypothetical protein